MGRYIVSRSLQAIPVVVATSIVVFLILHLAPGDPVRMLASPTATEQDLANLRSRLGLDQPLPIQYGRWMASVLQGDMGESLRSERRCWKSCPSGIGTRSGSRWRA